MPGDRKKMVATGNHHDVIVNFDGEQTEMQTLTKAESKNSDGLAKDSQNGSGLMLDNKKREPRLTEFECRTIFPRIELKSREVLFAITIFFFSSLCITLVAILATKNDSPQSNNEAVKTDANSGAKYCLTKECLYVSYNLLNNMDTTANPCEDFWTYACGGWIKNNPLPPSEHTWGVDSLVERRIEHILVELLGRSRRGLAGESAERKTKLFYAKCIAVEEMDAAGASPIVDVINSLGGWAVHDDWDTGNTSALWNVNRAITTLHFKYLVDALFTVWVGVDDRNPGEAIIRFDQEGLGLSTRALYLQNGSHPTVTAYKQYMKKIVKLFNVTNRKADQVVKNIFNFEMQLAKLHTPEGAEERNDPSQSYNKITVNTLQTISPQINWLELLQEGFPSTKGDTKILVANKKYMENISKLIQRMDKKILNYYLIWRLVDRFASKLSKPFRRAKEQYDQIAKGLQKAKPRREFCLELVNERFGVAVGAMFIKEHFPPDRKHDVTDVIEHIKEAFTQVLRDTDLLDQKTKKKAIHKADQLRHRIGYPEYLTNVSEVNKYYRDFVAKENESFFQLYQNSLRYDLLHMQIKLKRGNDPNSTEWTMNPQEVNAYFSPVENLMAFPAGILQPPYYNKGAPNYVNYGAIGSTIGHEITHGFDRFGSSYAANGSMTDWWSQESRESYSRRSQCLKDFYSDFKVQGLQVNGEFTFDENIADSLGLRNAYNGYKLWEKEHGPEINLPGLNLTNDKAFFLAFGQNYCATQTREYLEEHIHRDNHAPPEVRVKGALAQSAEFQNAFKCKSTNAMTPARRCHVW